MANKWNCPTCGKPNIPRGMHCRECLCDIFGSQPIGTTHRFLLEYRRRKPPAPKDRENDYLS